MVGRSRHLDPSNFRNHSFYSGGLVRFVQERDPESKEDPTSVLAQPSEVTDRVVTVSYSPDVNPCRI